METVIRQADIDDLDILMAWRMEVLREVFGIPAGQDMTELEQANRSYYQTMLKTDGHIACFACQEETIGCGGICIYQEMPSPDNPTGMCAYLMNIYTRPQFRGQGTGEQIVRWLVEQAMRRGITKIYLETSDCGRKLYQKIGFTPITDYLKLNMAAFDRNCVAFSFGHGGRQPKLAQDAKHALRSAGVSSFPQSLPPFRQSQDACLE